MCLSSYKGSLSSRSCIYFVDSNCFCIVCFGLTLGVGTKEKGGGNGGWGLGGGGGLSLINRRSCHPLQAELSPHTGRVVTPYRQSCHPLQAELSPHTGRQSCQPIHAEL